LWFDFMKDEIRHYLSPPDLMAHNLSECGAIGSPYQKIIDAAPYYVSLARNGRVRKPANERRTARIRNGTAGAS